MVTEHVVISVLATAAFLCWGSFLNVIAYRLLFDIPFLKKRSECPWCHTIIAWYDLVPVISWIVLSRRCRTCKKPISWLYPLIELTTALSFWGILLQTPHYFWTYALFFSALIVTIRTDLETMVVHRFCTVGMLPFALIASACHTLPLSLSSSLLGMLLGYSLLAFIRWVYWKRTNLIGVGQGDLELLAIIGAFLGPLGCWLSLLIGSFLGTLSVLLTMPVNQRHRHAQFPFGPFLALGAIITTIFQKTLVKMLLGV